MSSSSSSILKQRHSSSSNQKQKSPQSSYTVTSTSTKRTTTTALSISSISNHIVVTTNILIFVFTNELGCMISLIQPHSHYHVDILGTGAFAISGLYTLLLLFASFGSNNTTNIRILYSSIAMIVWSCRLAFFLLYRIIQQNGHDSRLTTVLSVPSSAIGFWCISALWGIICSVPHWMGTIQSQVIGSTTTLYLGIITFFIGFLIETTADAQKWFYKQQTTSNQFCNVGLWSISQHPNWFGNLVLWIGIFIMNSSSYMIVVPQSASVPSMKSVTTTSGSSHIVRPVISFLYRYHRFVLASFGPMFMYTLFYSQATGIILGDTLQANQNKYGYGTNIEYTNYIDHTPLIVPNLSQLLVQWIRSR